MGVSDDRAIVAELARRLEAGEELVVVTALRMQGAPPCRPGQKVLLSPDGPLAGTLGCSELDAQALGIAREVLARAAPTLATLDHDLGKVDTYFEPYPARPVLVVLGATPVAAWLLRWAPGLGYDTILVEPRRAQVTSELGALAGSTLTSPDQLAIAASAGTGTVGVVDAVHTDHDAPMLAEHLAVLLRSGARFVGVMGSARHVGHHLAALRQMGLPESSVSAVRSPVGLDIGARSPAEIALSILAGLVAARSGRNGGWLDPPPLEPPAPDSPTPRPIDASD